MSHPARSRAADGTQWRTVRLRRHHVPPGAGSGGKRDTVAEKCAWERHHVPLSADSGSARDTMAKTCK